MCFFVLCVHINLKYRLNLDMDEKGINGRDCCPGLPPEPRCPLPCLGNGQRDIYIGGGALAASSM